MILVVAFRIHLTHNDPAGSDDLGGQRFFQLPPQTPGLPLQKLAHLRSLRFRKPLQKRKVFIRGDT